MYVANIGRGDRVDADEEVPLGWDEEACSASVDSNRAPIVTV